MEKRIAKVNISSAGGTAAKGSKTCKITLPTSWLETLGVNENRREMELSFDGDRIIITRRLSIGELAAQKPEPGHDVRILRFYDGGKLCTTIYADFTNETLTVENHISDPVKMAFGNNAAPTWANFQSFLAERCVPRQRAGLREYLKAIGLDEYDPLAIIQKTTCRKKPQLIFLSRIYRYLSELHGSAVRFFAVHLNYFRIPGSFLHAYRKANVVEKRDHSV